MKRRGFTPLGMCKDLGNRLRLRNWSRSMLNIYALSDASEAHPALLNVFRQRTQPYYVRRNEQRNLSTYNEKQVSPTGITLIEILVALAILGMIAMALYGILKGGLDVWRGGKERTDIIAQARVTMDRLTRELRATGGIGGAEDTYIYFSTDLSADGTEDEIRYSWPSGTELFRGLGSTPDYKVIARSINNFSLYYYSKDGTQIAPPIGTDTQEKRNMIWMIAIEARVKEDDNIVNLRSTVQPRNYSYPQ